MESCVQEIDRGADRVDAVAQVREKGQLETGVSRPDSLLRPRDARGHGRLRHHENRGDVDGCDTAHQPQGQRDPSFLGEVGVARHEGEPEAVVIDWGGLDLIGNIVVGGQERQLAGEGRLPPHTVDGDAFADRREPGSGIGGAGDADLGGADKGFLRAFLGEVEVAGEPDEICQDA